MNLPKDKNELKETYFSWLNKNQENLKPIISNALNAIYNVSEKKFDSSDIENIVIGLKLNHTYSYALAEYVSEMAEKESLFANILIELSKHPSSKVRLNVITNCLYNRPKQIVDSMLTEALNDKSKQVRLKAADCMLRLGKTQLIDNLTAQIKIEKDSEVKKTLCWTFELLNKNWTFEPQSNYVRVLLKNGGIGGFYLKNAEDIQCIELIEKSVNELRNKH